MLDDIKYIANRDKQDALGMAERQPQQLLYDFSFKKDFQPVENIVICGMGGSALAGSMALSWPGPAVPVVLDRSYHLPPFAGQSTFCIILSYSGNTQEALVLLDEAEERGCQIAVITSGGELEKRTKEKYALLKVPAGLRPRLAVWHMYRGVLELFEAIGLGDEYIDELESCADFLQDAAFKWRPDVHSSTNVAKQLAEEIAGKTPIVYAGPDLSAAAYKWKTNFNENAKNVAYSSVIPEANHNEIIGWTSHPVAKPFAVIQLRSDLYEQRVSDSFEVMNRLLSGRMPHPITIEAEGDTLPKQLLWSILLGDFVSIYLGLINNVNPSDIELIEKFKQEVNTR